MKTSDTSASGGTIRYRIVVSGRIATEWVEWFGADILIPAGENSVLEVEVSDQAELFGRLRRVHDLHLRLISVERMDPSPKEPSPSLDPQTTTRSHPHE